VENRTESQGTEGWKKTMKCKCVEKTNKKLAEMGVELETSIVMDFNAGKARTIGPFLSVRWLEKSVRGKTLPIILCTFCPICGKEQDA
jgi:hypothetical protein